MRMRTLRWLLLCGWSVWGVCAAQDRLLPLAAVRSGLEFAGRDVKALQADVQANPAQLWPRAARCGTRPPALRSAPAAAATATQRA